MYYLIAFYQRIVELWCHAKNFPNDPRNNFILNVHPNFEHLLLYALIPGGRGGGVLSFFFIRRLGPSTYRSTKNIRNFKHKKKYLKFCNPKKYPPFCTFTLRKDPKLHINDQYSPIFWWPQKNIHKIFIPQKIFILLKTPKSIEIQNFEPQKMIRSQVCMKILEYPPPPPPPPAALSAKYSLTST